MKKTPRLLLIDDDEEILVQLKNFFIKKNYNVVSASNGLDGLKLIEADQDGFDIVVTDIVMPNISGVGLISILKGKYPKTPVIAMTGWGEHPEALAREADPDLVIEKPFDPTDLERIIADLIAKS